MSKLLGDMSADMLKKIGGDKLAKAYERFTGKPCGCAKRRQALNRAHRAVNNIINRPGRSIPQVARPPKQHIPPTKPVDEQ
jgi:hypothetical protein